MTNATPDLRDPRGLVTIWSEGMTQVIAGGDAGAAWTVLDEAPANAAQNEIWVAVAASGALRGEMAFRMPTEIALRMAQIFMGEPANGQVQLTSQHHDALLELFRQAGGLTATAVKAIRGEVRFQVDLMGSTPTWPTSSTAWLRWGQDLPEACIELHLSAALVASLREEPAPTASFTTSGFAAPADSSQTKLDLLMDVELGVTLRFGSRKLLLREVLDLNPGAVIALDRQVEEPVDMLLDGRIIARGEVVVVDGNYGFRISEIGAPA